MRIVTTVYGLFCLVAGAGLSCCDADIRADGYPDMNNYVRYIRCICLLLVLISPSSPARAQHTHGVLSPSVTFPQDDAVLLQAPDLLTMSFRLDVTLLKLALYTDNGDWIDINFRYQPGQLDKSFVYPLPVLPEANYYLVEWSVVDDRQRFLNGEFRFAFGPGAIPPSETIAASYKDVTEENLPATGNYAQGINR